MYILYTKNSLKIPFLEQQFFKNYLPDLQLLNRNYSSRTFQRWHLVESFRDEKKKKGKKKEIACNVFGDCIPRLTLNAYEAQGGRVAGGLDSSPRHLSERRPGEYRSVNERSPFPLARTRVPTTTPSPIGGSKVWRPWRPDGARKNGEGHGFRVPAREPMRNGRRESESKGDRADGSFAPINLPPTSK